MEEFPIGDPPHVHQPLIETIVAELNGRALPQHGNERGANRVGDGRDTQGISRRVRLT
jgi:hypothetical protein